jgi:hypothetical protein
MTLQFKQKSFIPLMKYAQMITDNTRMATSFYIRWSSLSWPLFMLWRHCMGLKNQLLIGSHQCREKSDQKPEPHGPSSSVYVLHIGRQWLTVTPPVNTTLLLPLGLTVAKSASLVTRRKVANHSPRNKTLLPEIRQTSSKAIMSGDLHVLSN